MKNCDIFCIRPKNQITKKRNKLYHTVYDAGIVSAQRTVDYSNANNFELI